jgi:hypothetical protein
VQLMGVLMESGDAAEVDHEARILQREAQVMSQQPSTISNPRVNRSGPVPRSEFGHQRTLGTQAVGHSSLLIRVLMPHLAA